MALLTIPFLCALLYAAGFIFGKRTILLNNDFRSALALYNWILGVVFSPLVFLHRESSALNVLYQPASIRILLFLGIFLP